MVMILLWYKLHIVSFVQTLHDFHILFVWITLYDFGITSVYTSYTFCTSYFVDHWRW